MKKTSNLCKTCTHWKNQQAELEYSDSNGFCVCPKWKFGVSNYADVKVLNRNARTDKYMGVSRFESIPTGLNFERSQYLLVTEETFGCIHHEKIS